MTKKLVRSKQSKKVKSSERKSLMIKMERKNAEDTIIKVLNHEERREILRILNASPEGLKYSSILGETKLSTSKLNYQLKELEGFIEKDEEKREYNLTSLGKKAIMVLNNIGENLDPEDIKLTHATESRRRNFIRKYLNGFFYFLMIMLIIGPIVGTYFYFADPASGLAPLHLGLITAFCVGSILLLNRARSNSPKYLLSFIDWLDWKFFDVNGLNGFKGRKVFVLSVLGLILGALFGKAGFGLIIGLFLGAAMEL
jgi:predicted transcriptional regulator